VPQYDARPALFGRLHVPEPPSSLRRQHFAAAAPVALAPVEWPSPIPVLDQEDLFAQGIDTAVLVPGARRVDELGSCVANATTAALAAVAPRFLPDLGSATVIEEFAIGLYHQLTFATGDPAAEWPPEDCGSSGLAACQYLERLQFIAGHQVAHGAENVLSLMQAGGLIVGQPWFNAWMEPSAAGFIDGDGSAASLQAAISSGVAGGHETYWEQIVEIGYDLAGGIDPAATIIRFRNSWGTGWALGGHGLAHLSTFMLLGGYCDFRQLVP
jgi:hypothetical protein